MQALDLSMQEAVNLISRWQSTPRDFFGEVLGVEKTWKLQDDLCNAIPAAIKEKKQIFIGSGHALGKDYICAAVSLWFLQSFKPSIVIQTGPTDRQVKKVMWGETLSHWNKRKIDLGGVTYTNPYLEMDRKLKWYLLGFTTKETGATKDGGGGKFSGFHSENICVIISEAQAVEENIYDQIDGITASGNTLVIFIGNPTRAKGGFARGLRDRKNNIVFNFSCLDNPNYKERRTVIPGLASYEWVEDKRRKWGEGDPRWQGRVLGQIPSVGVNSVFSDELINHMKERSGMIAKYSDNAGLAWDPAGEGVDDEVFMAGRGGEPRRMYKKTKMAPSVGAVKAIEMCKAINGNFIVIDCDGVGIKCWQELNKLTPQYLQGIQIVKFHGSAPSQEFELMDDGSKRAVYQNMRSEAAFVAQKRATDGQAALDENAKMLIEDLMEDEYFTNNRGLLQIIDKDDIKERLLRSPGEGDAYKMLQWAFSQNYKRDTEGYVRDKKLPEYAVMDDSIMEPNPQMLPREGVMS